MKAVAIIKQLDNDQANQWQFDKVMAAIAYDIELTVVFMPNAIKQLTFNKAWKSLILYGVDGIFFYNKSDIKNYHSLVNTQEINSEQFSLFIQKTDLIL